MSGAAASGPITRPNILVIIADQLRRSALSCAGDPNVSTPHIDRLAAEGVRFASSCVTYPVCVPSRFTADDRDPDRPFFLILSVEPPHSPLVAPEPYLARWRDRELVLAPNVPNVPDAAGDPDAARAEKRLDDLRRYYAMVENLDDNVGALLRFMGEQGMRDDTAIVFLADHGDLKGSHGLDGKDGRRLHARAGVRTSRLPTLDNLELTYWYTRADVGTTEHERKAQRCAHRSHRARRAHRTSRTRWSTNDA